MNRRKAGCLAAATLLFVSLTIAQVVRTLKDPRCDTAYLYTADILQPATLFEDLFVDGYSLRSYQLSGANFIFPDQCLYFAVRAVVGNARDAVAVWSLMIFPLVILGAIVAARATVRPSQRWLTTAMVIFAGAGLVVASSRDFFADPAIREVFLPVFHNGAVFSMMLGIGLTIHSLRNDRRRAALLAASVLFLLCAATTASDRLFASWFVAPALVSIVALRLFDRSATTWGRVIVLLVAIGTGGVVGIQCAKWIHGPADAIQNYWTEGIWNGFSRRWLLLAKTFLKSCQNGNILGISAWLWFVLSASCLGISLMKRLRGRLAHHDAESASGSPGITFYFLFSIAVTFGNAAVFLISKSSANTLGQHSWNDIARYFAGPSMAAFFGWPILFSHRTSRAILGGWRVSLAMVPTAALLLLLSFSLFESRDPGRPLIDDYPETVRRVDEACARLGLTDGLGDYDAAKRITFLSRRGVRVRQIAFDPHLPNTFAVFHWLSNAEWHWQPPRSKATPINYEFILVHPRPVGPHEPSPERLEQLFGPARERIDVGGYLMLVFNRPTDRFRNIVTENDCLLQNLQFRFGGEPRVRYAGGSFHSPTILSSIESKRTVTENRDTPGLFAYGPFLTPPHPGRYRVTMCTTTSGVDECNGSVDVALNLAGKLPTIIAQQKVAPSAHQLTTMDFEIDTTMLSGKLEFRTFFTGRGTLTLNWVEFERVP